MKYFAIIVAGGTGKRMQNAIPKQFLPLSGEPVLFHTIKAFHQSATRPELILALHPDQHYYWKTLCETHAFDIPHQLVDGGAERFFSVKNALEVISGDGVVAVHDGVRPLLSSQLIDKLYKEAAHKGNAVAAISPSESVRYNGAAIDRSETVLVQTPQIFDISILKKAYELPYMLHFTDDATVVESAGYQINLVEGERRNIKITWPEDFTIGELWLNGK